MNPELPRTFVRTRHSPTLTELESLHNWCKHNLSDNSNILEFGAGPTTWAIATAVRPATYVCVEEYAPSIQQVIDHLTDVTVIKGSWYKIPEDVRYDFIFVDSSAGYPPGDGGLHRDEAVKYGERLLSDNGYIALHDWHARSGKAPRKYLESTGHYELVASVKDRTGLGIYRRCF